MFFLYSLCTRFTLFEKIADGIIETITCNEVEKNMRTTITRTPYEKRFHESLLVDLGQYHRRINNLTQVDWPIFIVYASNLKRIAFYLPSYVSLSQLVYTCIFFFFFIYISGHVFFFVSFDLTVQRVQ